MEEKEKVLIEEVEDEKVAVYHYDDTNLTVIGTPFEVCHKLVAMEQYDVVGEVSVGDITLYEGSFDEDGNDYTQEDFLLQEEDDD